MAPVSVAFVPLSAVKSNLLVSFLKGADPLDTFMFHNKSGGISQN